MRHETFSNERTREIVSSHLGLEGPLLPILHAVRETFGYVPEAAVPVIAEELNLSRAEVHGVVTFYHDFNRAPHGRHVVKICRAEACQSVGVETLVAHAERSLGVSMGETSPDGRVTLEPIYCLGLCACAPAAMVDGRIIGRLDMEAIDEIVAEVDR
ncbi:formate dehydrogenase subunit gamma [Methylobrevis pamukkalensis]|uniref:NADP-reducing hydrogenase subunit HndA n=1 Tax=Methylobrevis pamukkalensis TaxID=1439726 RepID=A0A1E3H5F3_9HYPH|nr:formate dehydrogenase subunit gamma [Methylobrevis pamukkalensis]ODN71540.1 NADP-reducing hydrogenase subunit HndA [Methylobrevis pamukkalensis]